MPLDAIIDTGAAGNYISAEMVKKMVELNPKRIKIEDVKTQGVRLANGAQETCSKIAIFKAEMYHKDSLETFQFNVSAYILPLPKISLILGLPWHKDHKPTIDFTSGTYTVKKGDGVFDIEPKDCKPKLFTIDDNNFGQNLEREAKVIAPDCFAEELIIKDHKQKHYIDTGDSKPIKTHGRPHTPA